MFFTSLHSLPKSMVDRRRACTTTSMNLHVEMTLFTAAPLGTDVDRTTTTPELRPVSNGVKVAVMRDVFDE